MIRGKNKCIWNCHQIRLYIEWSSADFLFITIHFKTTTLRNESQLSRSTHRCFYKASLVWNCNHRQISLIIERKKRRHNIDANFVSNFIEFFLNYTLTPVFCQLNINHWSYATSSLSKKITFLVFYLIT